MVTNYTCALRFAFSFRLKSWFESNNGRTTFKQVNFTAFMYIKIQNIKVDVENIIHFGEQKTKHNLSHLCVIILPII